MNHVFRTDRRQRRQEWRSIMAISDEIRQEKQKTKNMSLKGKLSYFWDYYKIHTIVVIVAVFLITVIIRDIVNSKDYAFYGIYFNAVQSFSADGQMEQFSEYMGIDTENYQALLDTGMYYSLTNLSETTIASSQKFAAMVQAGDVDIVVSDEDVFANYAANELFYDLREVLPADLLEKYKDDIFYIDGAQIEALNTDENMDYEEEQEYYADLKKKFTQHHDASVLKDPIPVGIYVGDTPVIVEAGCYPQSTPVFGIVKNTTRLDTAVGYLRFLGEEEK